MTATPRADQPPRYKAACKSTRCGWTSRPYIRYSTAENAARDHTDTEGHTTHVVDHYGLHVAGSTLHPGA